MCPGVSYERSRASVRSQEGDAKVVHRSPLIIMVIASVLLLGAVGLIGCGSTGATSTTLSPSTGETAPPPSGGTTSAETTALVGTTVLGGQTPALTSVSYTHLTLPT